MNPCSRCGHRNDDLDRFCGNCGEQLREETAGLPAVEGEEGQTPYPFPGEALSPGEALILVRNGAAAGSTFLLAREVTTIGRDPGSDVFLDDVTVSRKHAEVRRHPDGFYVHDLGSLNGTYVNRERVDVTKLASGDEVQVGRYKLVAFVAGS